MALTANGQTSGGSIVALGAAIRRARGDRSQKTVGERLGDILGEPVPQTTISRWEKGMVDLSVRQVAAIEQALELQSGALFIESGYVHFTGIDVVAAILRDDNLSPEARPEMVAVYQAVTRVDASSNRPRRRRSKGPTD